MAVIQSEKFFSLTPKPATYLNSGKIFILRDITCARFCTTMRE